MDSIVYRELEFHEAQLLATIDRRGIGRTLTEVLAREARARGATSLYISATPTRGTVDAYLSMGATLLESPDPEMLAREPDDIHLVLELVGRIG